MEHTSTSETTAHHLGRHNFPRHQLPSRGVFRQHGSGKRPTQLEDDHKQSERGRREAFGTHHSLHESAALGALPTDAGAASDRQSIQSRYSGPASVHSAHSDKGWGHSVHASATDSDKLSSISKRGRTDRDKDQWPEGLKRTRKVFLKFRWDPDTEDNGGVQHDGFAECLSVSNAEGPPSVKIELLKPFPPGYQTQPGSNTMDITANILTPVELGKWNATHVADWVGMVGSSYRQYKQGFMENQVDGATLQAMEIDDFIEDLAMKKIHARHLSRTIGGLKKKLVGERKRLNQARQTQPRRSHTLRECITELQQQTSSHSSPSLALPANASAETSPLSLPAQARSEKADPSGPSVGAESVQPVKAEVSPALGPEREIDRAMEQFFIDESLPPSLEQMAGSMGVGHAYHYTTQLHNTLQPGMAVLVIATDGSASQATVTGHKIGPNYVRVTYHHSNEVVDVPMHAVRVDQQLTTGDRPPPPIKYGMVPTPRHARRNESRLNPNAAQFRSSRSENGSMNGSLSRSMSEHGTGPSRHAGHGTHIQHRPKSYPSRSAPDLLEPEYNHSVSDWGPSSSQVNANHIWQYNDGMCSLKEHYGKKRLVFDVPGTWHRFPKAIEERIAKAAKTGQRSIRYHIHNRHYILKLGEGWSAKDVSYYKEENERDGRLRMVRYAKFRKDLWTPQVGDQVVARVNNEWLDADVCQDNGDGSYQVSFGRGELRRVMIENIYSNREKIPTTELSANRPANLYQGKIVKYFGASRYGFIESSNFNHDVFFHLSSVDGQSQVKRHACVEFGSIERKGKGWTANYVNILRRGTKEEEPDRDLNHPVEDLAPPQSNRTIKLSPIPETAKVGHILGALKWAIGAFKARNRVQIENGCCYIEFRADQTFRTAITQKSIPFGTQGFRINITKAEEHKLDNGKIRVVAMYNGRIFRGRVIRLVESSGSGFLESRKRKGIYFPADQAAHFKLEIGMYVDYQQANNPHPDFRGRVIAINLKPARLPEHVLDTMFSCRFPWLTKKAVMYSKMKFDADIHKIWKYLCESKEFKREAWVRVLEDHNDADTYISMGLLDPTRGRFLEDPGHASRHLMVRLEPRAIPSMDRNRKPDKIYNVRISRDRIVPLEMVMCLTCGAKAIPNDDVDTPEQSDYPACVSVPECPDCERLRVAEGRQPGSCGTQEAHRRLNQEFREREYRWTLSSIWNKHNHPRVHNRNRGEFEETIYKGFVFALLPDGGGVIMNKENDRHDRYHYFMSLNGYPTPKLGSVVTFTRSRMQDLICDYRGHWKDHSPQWLRGVISPDEEQEGAGIISVPEYGRQYKYLSTEQKPDQVKPGASVYVQVRDGEIIDGPREAEVINVQDLGDRDGRIGIDSPVLLRDSLLRIDAEGGDANEKMDVEKKLFENLRNDGDVVQIADAAVKYTNAFLNSNGGLIIFGVDEESVICGQSRMTARKRRGMIAKIKAGLEAFKPSVPPQLYDITETKVAEKVGNTGYVLPDVYVFIVKVKAAPNEIVPFRTPEGAAWESSWGSITTYRDRDRLQKLNKMGSQRIHADSDLPSPHGSRDKFNQSSEDDMQLSLDNNEVSI